MNNAKDSIANLKNEIDSTPDESKSEEIKKISGICNQFLRDGEFPWKNKICRKVGDLIIGLQSRQGSLLISSNYKEHSVLSKGIGYGFKKFEVAKLRPK